MKSKPLLIAAVCVSMHLAALPAPFAKNTGRPADPLALDAEEAEVAPKPALTASPVPASGPVAPSPEVTPATNASKASASKSTTPGTEPAKSSRSGGDPLSPQPAPVRAPVFENSRSARFGELDALRSQNALLAERAKAAELLSKLKGTGGASQEVRPTRSSGIGSTADGASLIAVEGIDRERVATVLMPSGQKMSASVGTHLPGLGVVQSISLTELCLSAKSGQNCIAFRSAAPGN